MYSILMVLVLILGIVLYFYNYENVGIIEEIFIFYFRNKEIFD